MMNKELERLITSIQALKQIFDDLGLDANVEIEYKDDTKETINVYEVIEKQIVKDINLYDSQLTIEEIERIDLYLNCDLLNDIDGRILNKLQNQKEMLENKLIKKYLEYKRK